MTVGMSGETVFTSLTKMFLAVLCYQGNFAQLWPMRGAVASSSNLPSFCLVSARLIQLFIFPRLLQSSTAVGCVFW